MEAYGSDGRVKRDVPSIPRIDKGNHEPTVQEPLDQGNDSSYRCWLAGHEHLDLRPGSALSRNARRDMPPYLIACDIVAQRVHSAIERSWTAIEPVSYQLADQAGTVSWPWAPENRADPVDCDRDDIRHCDRALLLLKFQ
jgi:hypothetical protein